MNVLRIPAVNHHREVEPQRVCSNKENPIPKKESASESDWKRLAREDLLRMVCEAVEEHKERKLRRLIDDRCEKVGLALLRKLMSVPSNFSIQRFSRV